jgi:hypothetical protein
MEDWIMEVKYAIVLFGCLPLMIMLVSSWYFQSQMNKSHEKLVNAQQDTINKLLNREPVTYVETGQKQPKQSKESYAAWGNQTVDTSEEQE